VPGYGLEGPCEATLVVFRWLCLCSRLPRTNAPLLQSRRCSVRFRGRTTTGLGSIPFLTVGYNIATMQLNLFPFSPAAPDGDAGLDTGAKCWDDAVDRWVREQSHKASLKTDQMHFRWLGRYLVGRSLETIDRAVVESLKQSKLADGASNATVNRMLALTRSVLRRASLDWGWIPLAPHFRLLKEPTRRVRFLSREEAVRLLRELPPHLSDMAAFTLATGLRRANVTGLLWSQVNLTLRLAWIHPDQAKARKAIPVPLNDDAFMFVSKQCGMHTTHVFSYKGAPVIQVSTAAWYKALKRAGITEFRWHDLRHTWASWHAQAGTPLLVLQELGGWESTEMVRRYAHLGAGHLAAYAANLEPLRHN
jgi:integrase